jgi:hypothetical protein
MTDELSRDTLLLDQEVRERTTLRGIVNSITHTRVYEYTALLSNFAVVGVGSFAATESVVNGHPVGAAIGAAFATYSAFTLQDIARHMGQPITRDREKYAEDSREN